MTWAWFLAPLQPWDQLPWLTMCPLEIIATVFGLWSVACYVRESVWAWPAGLINVLLFIVTGRLANKSRPALVT